MNKGVEKILLEEKEVFDCNINALKNTLKESISSFIKKIRYDIGTEVNLDIYFKEKILEIENTFVSSITNKRNNILDEYILNKQIYSKKIREDKEYIEIISSLSFSKELIKLINDNKLQNTSELFKNYNLNLIKEIETVTYKLFESLMAYLNDIESNSITNNISYTASIMMNTFYKELKCVTQLEKENYKDKINIYKNEIMESLETIIPRKKLLGLKKFIENNYINITISIYNNYINYILSNIYKIILGTKIDKIDELKSVELPFLEYLSTLKKKRLDNKQVIDNFIFNLTIKVYNSYDNEDYEKLYTLLEPILNKINEELLEVIENLSTTVSEVILNERSHLDKLVPRLDKMTINEINNYFNNQKQNISIDNYRI